MSELTKIKDNPPELEKSVLLHWSKSGHFEDGYIYMPDHVDDDSGVYFHCLFDGEALNDQPDYWMPLPKLPGE